MRYHTSSDVSLIRGSVKDPLLTPLYCWKGWVWVLWCNKIIQLYAFAGRVPSSGSVAEPLNEIVSPASYFVPIGGLIIVPTGGLPTVIPTVSVSLPPLPSLIVRVAV